MCILLSVFCVLSWVVVSPAVAWESPLPFSEAPAPQPFQYVQFNTDNPFGYANPDRGYYGSQQLRQRRRQRSEDTYQRQQRQRQTLQDALAPWTPDPQVDYMQRRDAMRRAEINGCNAITHNSAARSSCLEAIR